VQICASIASTLGQLAALSRQNLRRLLPVGAAADIAAAFNAPSAAITFSIEEVVGDLDQTVLTDVMAASAPAAAIEKMMCSRSGKAAPAVIVNNSARAAANDKPPRNPAHASKSTFRNRSRPVKMYEH